MEISELQSYVKTASMDFAEHTEKLQALLDRIGWGWKLAAYGNGYEGTCPICGGKCVLRFDPWGEPLAVWAVCLTQGCFKSHPAFKPNLVGFVRAVQAAKFDPSDERFVLGGMFNYQRKANLSPNDFKDPFNKQLYVLFSKLLDQKRTLSRETVMEWFKGHIANEDIDQFRSISHTKPEVSQVREAAERMRHKRGSVEEAVIAINEILGNE